MNCQRCQHEIIDPQCPCCQMEQQVVDLKRDNEFLRTALRALVQECGCDNPTGGNEFHRWQHRAMVLLEKGVTIP